MNTEPQWEWALDPFVSGVKGNPWEMGMPQIKPILKQHYGKIALIRIIATDGKYDKYVKKVVS